MFLRYSKILNVQKNVMLGCTILGLQLQSDKKKLRHWILPVLNVLTENEGDRGENKTGRIFFCIQ